MTQKLTDMQLVLLATACQREDGSLLPPPASLGDQAARIRRAVTSLIKRMLASELDVTDAAKSWREDCERHIGVVITDAGRAVITAEEEDAGTSERDDAPVDAAGEDQESDAHIHADIPDAPADGSRTEADTASAASPTGARAGSKQALVIDLMRREGGATLADLVGATGWLPHTTRAALTGLRKKGHPITKTKRDDLTCYVIGEAA